MRYILAAIPAAVKHVEKDTEKLVDTGTTMGVTGKAAVPIYTKKEPTQKEETEMEAVKITEVSVTQMFRALILVCGGSVINGAYPV